MLGFPTVPYPATAAKGSATALAEPVLCRKRQARSFHFHHHHHHVVADKPRSSMRRAPSAVPPSRRITGQRDRGWADKQAGRAAGAGGGGGLRTGQTKHLHKQKPSWRRHLLLLLMVVMMMMLLLVHTHEQCYYHLLLRTNAHTV